MPRCGEGRFSLEGERESRGECITGTVKCLSCKLALAIRDGILDLLWEPSGTVRKEIEGQKSLDSALDEERTSQAIEITPENYRSLPFGDGSPVFSVPGTFQRIATLAPDVELMVSRMKLQPEETVLDIGADICWASAYMAQRGARVVAVDVSQHLTAANIYFAEGSYFERVLCDMKKLHFKPNSIDAIACFATLHHSEDLALTFGQFYRVLKEGGRVMIMDEPLADFGVSEEWAKEEREYGINENIYNLREYLEAAQAAGFECRAYLLAAKVADLCLQRLRSGDRPCLKLLLYRLVRKACIILSISPLSTALFALFQWMLQWWPKNQFPCTLQAVHLLNFGLIARKSKVR